MRFPHSLSSYQMLAVNFLLTGVFTYFAFGLMEVCFTTSVRHVYDLSPRAERLVGMVGWWLWAIPGAWLVAFTLALFEASHQNRFKRLAILIFLPIFAVIISFAVASASVWFIVGLR